MTIELVSAGDLAKAIGRDKSTVAYYQRNGLIKPIGVAGKTMVYNKTESLARLKKIDSLKKKGKELEEIKTILDADKTA